MESCSRLHINKDFITKLEIFKILLLEYEDEIYQDIINDEQFKKYLKVKSELEQKDNGSNRN